MKPTKKTHDIRHSFGQVVRLKTDREKEDRIITSITLWDGGCVKYCVSCGTDESWHYDFELEVVEERQRPSYLP